LRGVSFALAPGEMAFVTGRSGAGKSTLLRLAAGIERPTRGEVVVNGQNVARLRRGALARFRQRIGFVFQDYKLLQGRTVFDNVALPLVVAGAGAQETGRRVRAALDRVGLLGKERALPRTLSGGEQQRVGIARAVVARPAALLADEPTGNLDPQLAREVIELFRDFSQVGVCVLVASHDLELIRRLRTRVITLERGELVADG
jgi:cell division transport system ATP-binding protein